MASSSALRGAGRAPPPPDKLAVFYKLVDKNVIAGVLCRHARSAELLASAAVQAEALFGNESLVVANLRLGESQNFTSLTEGASRSEEDRLDRCAWAVLLSVLPLLLRRIEADTLLPGTIREEEMDYFVHHQAALCKAKNKPVPSPAQLRAASPLFGYITLLSALCRSLELLPMLLWPVTQRRMVESFVLQGLDIIPRTAGIPEKVMAGEARLVATVEKKLNTRNLGYLEPTFCVAFLRKWRSNAVSSVLRARGVLQAGIAVSQEDNAEFEARQRADVAKHGLRVCALPSCSKTEKTAKEFAGCTGCRSVVYCCLEHQALDWDTHRPTCADIVEHGLRDCALPSCSKTEKTVKEFAGCSGCRSVVYCCLEHQALDWRAHKKACRETKAARQAAEEDAGGEAGAGAAT